MTKEEAHDFIARHYITYINQLVFFESANVTGLVKAIDVVEGEHSDFVPTCYLESPKEEDPEFKDHIFAHISLQDLIATGRVVSS